MELYRGFHYKVDKKVHEIIVEAEYALRGVGAEYFAEACGGGRLDVYWA